ncbi:MAG: hypothetical protein BGP16_02575 [Sphingobium sp. 66-54]|nr:MAG: hypothetical protein BGP16_02575 [Sphingobium sp. 66-54]
MRSIPRAVALTVLTTLLGACATRGPLAVDCGSFDRFVSDLPYSPLEAQIRNNWPPQPDRSGEQTIAIDNARPIRPGAPLPPPPPSEAIAPPPAAQTGPLAADRIRKAVAAAQAARDRRAPPAEPSPPPPPPPPPSPDRALPSARLPAPPSASAVSAPPALPGPETPSVLLLSGGGQWGAFGAGLLTTLAADNSPQRPNPIAITGVSTGALQMLFVGAGLEHADVRAALRTAYSPASESEIVDRQSKALAILTGAMSGLKPLRRRIETALCPDDLLAQAERADAAPVCPVLDRLAASPVILLAGFVEARGGRFRFADINAMAADPELTAREKRTCIAGAALASAAMPVFFQQVQVGGKTYFDGGVRQSVFATFVQREIAAQMGHAAEPLPLFVLRNGPTDTDSDDKADGRLNALSAALRAEAIIVNQVEVGSVSALRLQMPRGPIGFASADGWQDERVDPLVPGAPTCRTLKAAGKDAQFTPAFMACLMAYGDRRAREPRLWMPLLDLDTAAAMR